MQNVGRGIRPPSSVTAALIAAIIGHALWNGTAVGAPWIALYLTQSEGISVIVSLLTTVMMVGGILGIGNMILNGVNDEKELRPY